MTPDYTYRAKVVYVVDGDTVDFDVDLGFGVWLRKQRIRLSGINTPEVRGPEREEGRAATKWVADALHNAAEIVVKTEKDKQGKYGRWLGTIYYRFTDPAKWYNLNDLLVENGLAERVEY